tara:strand:- start:1074 stop:1550 length:477 start_codon:yes stop_codon:yes gene_type:complete
VNGADIPMSVRNGESASEDALVDEDLANKKLRRIAIIAVSGIISAIAIYGLLIVFLSWPITLGNIDKAGVFGDSFGILTSLFSGLAFAGIVITILLQRNELALQRAELMDTRKELSKHREVFELQSFESTFFSNAQTSQRYFKLYRRPNDGQRRFHTS